MLGSSKAFNTIFELNYGTLVHEFNDSAFVNATFSEGVLEYVPGVLFELLVTEREAAVVLVDFENNNLDVGANLSELRGVLDLLGPREVRDMDKAVNAFFEFNKYTEVGEVANLGVVT